QPSHRDPPTQSPPQGRGELVGGSKTRWAATAAHCFGLLRRPPIPNPFPEGRGHAHPPPARGRERGVQAEGGSSSSQDKRVWRLRLRLEHEMAYVRVEQ